jgi:hypothetical protein
VVGFCLDLGVRIRAGHLRNVVWLLDRSRSARGVQTLKAMHVSSVCSWLLQFGFSSRRVSRSSHDTFRDCYQSCHNCRVMGKMIHRSFRSFLTRNLDLYSGSITCKNDLSQVKDRFTVSLPNFFLCFFFAIHGLL